MINNTGYEEGYHELVDIYNGFYLSMFTEPSYYKRDEQGKIQRYKEPQEMWMSVALFHEELDYSVQQREFNEQADYFRYIAEIKKELEKNKEIKGDTYMSKGKTIKA